MRDGLEAPRWALSLAVLLFLILFLALLVLLVGPDPAHAANGLNFDQPTKDWYQGPVRYIITRTETKAYKALENDQERATFIDWFWQRRDIDPATPENEFRDRYEKRAFEATRKFSATTIPGWKTDMGKIYILVGAPDEVINDLMGKTHRGTVTWVYRKPPFPDMPPNTVIGFARDQSGEFRLSVNPTIDSDVARGLQFSKTKITADEVTLREGWTDPLLLAAGAPLAQNEIETRLLYGRMQQLPPHEEEMFKAFVGTKETYGSPIPMETRFDFYRAEGATFTTVTVGIRSSAVQYREKGGKETPDVGIFGKLVSRSNPDDAYALANDSSFAESPENGDAGSGDLLVFQAVGDFKPGVYTAILGVEDRVSRKVSSTRVAVEIPDLAGETLRLSTITMAGTMEPGEYAATVAKPFQIGKFRLIPKPDASFAKSDELNVYLQVYNPAKDEATGKPKLDVFYTFKSNPPNGTPVEFGTYRVQDSPAQVQGYAVPLQKWPEGAYLVTVTVVDKVASTRATADATFTIHP
ncbi:MAG TPA: GWxTD domain-containing protein [Candidatus Polarisedimenticolia bacterium]|nr:GWxTD domain-containing protein [Candidatus Polarisedimenticolia bacterium]